MVVPGPDHEHFVTIRRPSTIITDTNHKENRPKGLLLFSICCVIIGAPQVNGRRRRRGTPSLRGGDAFMDIKDALTLMMSFGALIITLLALVVTIVTAFNQNKK